ncbi:MAG: trypsin-like peptidase domain-containing protein [Treponema sp.]|nr:trypsin-like peptidase domain-containing protein [Treponema sp.]MEE3434447.1 trypsin-like peptidase domain-containing protein [Treponema sp.]
MKLYTRRHLFFSTITTVMITAAAVLGAQKIFFSGSRSQPQEAVPQKNADEESAALQSAPSQQSAQSAGSQFLQSQTLVASPAVTYTADEQQNISVYQQFNEAVVNITTQVMGMNWFFEPIAEDGGSGSGSIIDSRGYVITNVHVIEKATKIYISLYDGSQYEGRVIGSDVESDIAVLKFDPPKDLVLKTIQFGDSEKLKVGQKVIAIGNPFGFERTLTTGIVSALGRPIKNSNNIIIRGMIQTDASINPGNSGGPLLDTAGNMIGINTMIYSSSGSNAGIGFAVPASTARRVVSDLLQYGKVRRGAIQASLVQMSRAIADYARLDISYGILVSETARGGNADKAGIKGGTQAVRYGNSRNARTFYIGGDIIVGIDGVQVSTYSDYYSMLENKRPGDTVTVTIHRNKKNYDCKVVLAEESSVQ